MFSGRPLAPLDRQTTLGGGGRAGYLTVLYSPVNLQRAGYHTLVPRLKVLDILDQLPVLKSKDVHDALRGFYFVIQVVHQAVHRGKHLLADGQHHALVKSVSIFEEFDPDGFAMMLTVQKARWVALIALVAVLIVPVLLPDPLLMGLRDGHSVSAAVRGLGVILALTRLVRISLQKITFDVGFSLKSDL